MSYYKSIFEEIKPYKENLIKGLQLLQQHDGYISNEGLEAASDYFRVSFTEAEGVVTFYTQFKRQKPGTFHIAVCDGTACHIKGSTRVADWISTELNLNPGETDSEGRFSLETVACLGCCSLAPVVSINGRVYGNLDRKKLLKILKEYKNKNQT